MLFTSTTGAFIALTSLAGIASAATSPNGQYVHMFPNKQCSLDGYYIRETVAPTDKCDDIYWGDPNFKKNSEGNYKVWFQAPFYSNNEVVNIQTPLEQPGVQGQPCGYATLSLSSGECKEATVGDHFFINTCKNGGCPGLSKRNESEAFEPAIRHQNERRACSFNPASGDSYKVVAGSLQKVTNELNNEGGDSSQSEQKQVTYTMSSSNTFGVSESTEAGLFDIVQETVSFSYMYTYEKSKSVSTTHTFTVPAHSSGYGAFIPYFECSTGHFSGGCNGIPTNKKGQVCVPKPLGGNTKMQDGEYRFVQN